jgi:hypothetical protein
VGRRLKADYERGFVGRGLHAVWDRRAGERIRGLTENYIHLQAPAAGRKPGELERVTLRAADILP